MAIGDPLLALVIGDGIQKRDLFFLIATLRPKGQDYSFRTQIALKGLQNGQPRGLSPLPRKQEESVTITLLNASLCAKFEVLRAAQGGWDGDYPHSHPVCTAARVRARL